MFYRFSGIFIIVVALGFIISQIGITKLFDYPRILRSPMDVVLSKYYYAGKKLKIFWFSFAVSSLMLVPMSVILYKILNKSNTPYMIVATAFGMAAGTFYVLGLMRWTLLASSLSKKYMSENVSDSDKNTILMIFEAFCIYAGNSIGETMGFICMGIWIAITGVVMLKSNLFNEVTAVLFIICGIGILLGPLEWVGIKIMNKVNKIAIKGLMLLLVYIAIILIKY